MNKRISLVNEASLLCEVVIVLTDSQCKKLENGQLREMIDNIALDMHVCWSVEVNDNTAIGLIGRECGTVIDSDAMHQIEIDATNFMGAIDKLEIPADDIIHFDDNVKVNTEQLDFVKELLTDLNLPKEDENSVIGAKILCYGPKIVPFPLPWGKMSRSLLKELCELYISRYEHN